MGALQSGSIGEWENGGVGALESGSTEDWQHCRWENLRVGALEGGSTKDWEDLRVGELYMGALEGGRTEYRKTIEWEHQKWCSWEWEHYRVGAGKQNEASVSEAWEWAARRKVGSAIESELRSWSLHSRGMLLSYRPGPVSRPQDVVTGEIIKAYKTSLLRLNWPR